MPFRNCKCPWAYVCSFRCLCGERVHIDNVYVCAYTNCEFPSADLYIYRKFLVWCALDTICEWESVCAWVLQTCIHDPQLQPASKWFYCAKQYKLRPWLFHRRLSYNIVSRIYASFSHIHNKSAWMFIAQTYWDYVLLAGAWATMQSQESRRAPSKDFSCRICEFESMCAGVHVFI